MTVISQFFCLNSVVWIWIFDFKSIDPLLTFSLTSSLTKTSGALMTLQNQRQALEDAKANTDIFNVMRDAGKALKNTHKDLDIDKVEELMDEVKEQQQIANEISSVISDPRAFGQEEDEDDLLAVSYLLLIDCSRWNRVIHYIWVIDRCNDCDFFTSLINSLICFY